MITFKLNDKPLEVPTRWDETTYKHMCGIMDAKNTAEIIHALTGIKIDPNASIIGLEQLLIAVSFTNTKFEMPTVTEKVGPFAISTTDGKFNVKNETLAQFEDMRACMVMETTSDILKAYGKFVAIYLQKIRDGEYSHLKAVEMEEEISSYNAFEVMALGSFFFVKLRSFLTGIIPSFPSNGSTPPKVKPDSKPSTKSSGRLRQLPRRP